MPVKKTTLNRYSVKNQVTEHLRLRYGRRWQRKVRILLVMGNRDNVQKAAPGLIHDLWQEGDGDVLIYGGDAQSLSDDVFFSKLKRLRSANPLDGIVQVINSLALPDDIACDAFYAAARKPITCLAGRRPYGCG